MTRNHRAGASSKRRRWLAMGVLGAMGTVPVYGEPLPAVIRACRSLTDEAQRVRCYDAAVDGASAPPAADSAPPRAVAPAAGSALAPAPTQLFRSSVVALGFRPSGAANVTLANGQTWTQYGAEGRVPLKVGDAVTLRPGLFGAFVLVGPSGWITKVHLLPAPASGP